MKIAVTILNQIKTCLFLAGGLLLFCAKIFSQKPAISYGIAASSSQEKFTTEGSFRTIELNKIKTINPTGIRSKIIFPKHNLNKPQGSLEMWVATLEDISSNWKPEKIKLHNKNVNNCAFISDAADPNDIAAAAFAIAYNDHWHPQFYAKFYKGGFYQYQSLPQKAVVYAEAFTFRKEQWYQVVLSWDKPKELLNFYVNGVLVATSDKYHKSFYHDTVGTTLYSGSPALCYAQYNFYDKVLTGNEIATLYKKSATDFSPELDKELRYTFNGAGRKKLQFERNASWKEKLSLTLNKPSHLDSFYVQGYTAAPSITTEGLLVETPDLPQAPENLDKQVYLWTWKTFEGDLYVEYDFKILKEGGLSLLMTQASGMQREDFMKEYPLRTAGNMSTAYGQDVRNYHWEYYREMDDTRNDVASGAMIKNPYQYPLSYGTFNHLLTKNTWHKLQFLQRGNKIIGAIDGIILVEGTDDSFINNGPVYNTGHIAIRCMIHTKMLFRNLKVYNRNTAFTVIENTTAQK